MPLFLNRLLMRALLYPSGMHIAIALFIHYLCFWRLAQTFEPADSEMHGAIGFAYYYFVTMLTVGYGDIVPKSDGFRLLFILFGVSGIILYMIILGKGVTFVMDEISKYRKGMRKAMEARPVIILGWRPGVSESLIREHAGSNPDEKRGFVIVDDALHECPELPDLARSVQYVRGEPSMLETLRRANVPTATHIYVCGKTDNDNVAYVCSLSNLSPQCRVVVLLHDGKTTLPKTNMEVLRIPPSSPERAVMMMNDPCAGEIIRELVTTRDGKNLYQAALPEDFTPVNIVPFRTAFEAVFKELLFTCDGEFLPRDDITVRPGSVIVYAASARIGDWSPLIEHLKRSRLAIAA